ncbi:TIGR00266 family protein [Flavobacterium sp. F372]|uniref:TIGR00266 family protein n=1 Tax=Flavobacterium bernardetii TaxID=2813823 RepID=A0ABR7J0N1_9FLAO|nr:TIGR00266 family protein [Flavobacterium bernardetii]MBC5835567.1 TIGR00266 family protein [Flavobacterium bernardetii]NHF70931.1 TIGR00266 family protein [Flavobacterium bernardetii]
MNAHEIDYHIYGEEMQYVEIELDPQEVVIAEAGGFMMMEDGIKMETIFGDGSQQQQAGFMGKLLSAGKRVLTGESLFMTAFQNQASGKKKVSFAAPYPGKIIAIDLKAYHGKFICQKDAFLCAAKGVSVGIEFSKKIGRALFGGEGFIMQKIEGDGMAFVHSGGTLAKKELASGEIMRIDTGCVVGYTQDIDFDIEMVGGVKNTIFGGEGMFYATLRGPGTVFIQSLPFSRLAGRILANAPQNGGGKEEGSVLGGVGRLLNGDNF